MISVMDIHKSPDNSGVLISEVYSFVHFSTLDKCAEYGGVLISEVYSFVCFSTQVGQ